MGQTVLRDLQRMWRSGGGWQRKTAENHRRAAGRKTTEEYESFSGSLRSPDGQEIDFSTPTGTPYFYFALDLHK